MNIGFFENKYLDNGIVNFSLLQSVISRNKDIALWILPEVFDTGCNVTPKTNFNQHNSIETFLQWAIKYKTAICTSIYVKENSKIYNRFFFAFPTGEICFYNKRHLFGNFEKKYVTPGNQNIIIEYLGFKIRPIICYDLRFPVWCRNNNQYDILLCVSQWPLQRLADRTVLCKARAIENQAYVINVNAQGFSKIESPDVTNKIKQIRGSKSWVKVAIDKPTLDSFKNQRKYLNDGDSFRLIY